VFEEKGQNFKIVQFLKIFTKKKKRLKNIVFELDITFCKEKNYLNMLCWKAWPLFLSVNFWQK
jgi:hypothetical protein